MIAVRFEVRKQSIAHDFNIISQLPALDKLHLMNIP